MDYIAFHVNMKHLALNKQLTWLNGAPNRIRVDSNHVYAVRPTSCFQSRRGLPNMWWPILSLKLFSQSESQDKGRVVPTDLL